MRKNVVLSLIGFSSFWLASCGSDGGFREATPPTITFEEVSANVEGVTYGEIVEHTFKFRNSGEGNLVVHKVLSDCNCTLGNSTTTDVPPGGMGEIVMQVDTGTLKGFPVGFEAEAKPISVSKEVRVVTNDPRGDIALTISVKVAREFLFSGDHFIDFGTNAGGKGVVRELMIRAVGEAKLLSIRSSDKAVIASLHPVRSETGTLYRIRAEQLAASKGEHRGNLTVSTSSRSLGQLIVPVRGAIVPSSTAVAEN